MRILLLALLGLSLAGVRLARRGRPPRPNAAALIIPLPADIPAPPPRAGGAVTGRSVPLAGAPNFRDLGGYPTHTGQRVRWGRVYRSGALANLTAADLALLAALDLRLVCDLRSADEIEQDPDRLPGGGVPVYAHLPVVTADDGAARRQRLRALLFDRRLLQTMMAEFYTETMIDNNAGLFRAVFERLADPDNLPAVIHCTAGKDRAGLVSALLLLALGVPEDIVIADYSQSNRYYAHFEQLTGRSARPLRALGVRPRDLYPLLIADPDYLRVALAHLRARYGSVETYLRQQAGIDGALLDRLRANLLE